MKVSAFIVCLLCLAGLSFAQITFSRNWVRGKYPGEDGPGGNLEDGNEFGRDRKAGFSHRHLQVFPFVSRATGRFYPFQYEPRSSNARYDYLRRRFRYPNFSEYKYNRLN